MVLGRNTHTLISPDLGLFFRLTPICTAIELPGLPFMRRRLIGCVPVSLLTSFLRLMLFTLSDAPLPHLEAGDPPYHTAPISLFTVIDPILSRRIGTSTLLRSTSHYPQISFSFCDMQHAIEVTIMIIRFFRGLILPGSARSLVCVGRATLKPHTEVLRICSITP